MNDQDQAQVVFDTISAYFANTYWDALYQTALNDSRETRKFSNINEAYRAHIDRYMRALSINRDPQARVNREYVKIVQALHKFYGIYFRDAVTMGDFIDIVTRQFIPPEYYSELARQDGYKDSFFRRMLIKVIGQFTMHIIKSEIPNIVRNRERAGTKVAERLRDKLIDILNSERNLVHSEFLAQRHGIKVDPNGQHETVPKEVCYVMQRKMKKTMEQMAQLQQHHNRLVAYIAKLKTIVAEKDSSIQTFVTQLRKLGLVDDNGNIVAKNNRKVGVKSHVVNEGMSKAGIVAEEDSEEVSDDEEEIAENSYNSSSEEPEPVMKEIVAPLVTKQFDGEDFSDSDEKVPNGIVEVDQTVDMGLINVDDDSSYEDMIPDE